MSFALRSLRRAWGSPSVAAVMAKASGGGGGGSTPGLLLASNSGGTQGSTTYITPATTSAALAGQVAVAWVNSQFFVDVQTAFTDSVGGGSWTAGTEAGVFADVQLQSWSKVLTSNLPIGTTFTITATRIDGDFDVIVAVLPTATSLGSENAFEATSTGSTLSITGLVAPSTSVTAIRSTSGSPTITGTGSWPLLASVSTGSGTSQKGLWVYTQETLSGTTASMGFTVPASGDYGYGWRAGQE